MLNRRTAPPVHQVSNLLLPPPQKQVLDNGVPLYVLDFPGQEVLKIEVVFLAGRPQEEKRLAARATSRLLREGTIHRKGAEIAEHFDFYGASVSVPTNLDTANFVLYSLSKYADQVIPLFSELLQEPSFPEEELETFRRTSIQELSVELEKVETLAYRQVTELIFGENHPYGYNSVAEDYTAIQQQDLICFFEKWYTASNCLIFASGHVDKSTISLINNHLGKIINKKPAADLFNQMAKEHSAPGKPKAVHISRPDSLQTAIKIGRRAFGRKHPDFNGLFVLNTILGGYFGSRLMTQIREKKGFTYNIYSTLDAYLDDGCLYIATEVDTVNAAATVRAIFSEMKKLREKPLPELELEMVRNYLLGMLLNGLDGPLNTSDLVRGMVVEALPWASFSQMVETIRTITPEELKSLAQRYFKAEDFWTVTAG